ncbi:phenylalanine--tRNA ligase subunit beta [Candidatus Parvarchaeota archaeon]|nr:phenylalanine--tRNA ligase subunit beta [Candidatus Parvarchaeota archaeon]
MALITLSTKELSKFGNVGEGELEQVLTAIGVPVERIEGGEIDLEITPNRPDMLCVEGVGRAIRAFVHCKNPAYAAYKSGFKVLVDPSVQNIRPFIAVAVVKDVEITPRFLASLINLQEKLHDTMGRKRRKVAIGIHDASKIAFPLTYKAVSRDWAGFVPLDKENIMTPSQILRHHEKGIAYAHLVPGECPLIVDSKGQVLSFPPIINGELTRVTEKTRNVILDVTGTNRQSVSSIMNIIACAFADRGGKVFQVKVGKDAFPEFSGQRLKYPQKLVKSLLGLALVAQKRKKYLSMMGHGLSGSLVAVPPYRADVMHQIDIVEDIAIAHGLNNFPKTLPDFFSEGKKISTPNVHQVLCGMGLLECSSWILTSSQKHKAAGFQTAAGLEIKNKLTEDFAFVRSTIVPNLLEILGKSKDSAMPQKLYEVGPVWDGTRTKDVLCGAIAHHKVSFSEAKSVLKTLFFELGVSFEARPESSPAYIEGRCAGIVANGKRIGIFGEIHPQALHNFGIEQPVAAFELDLSCLG